MGISTFFSKLQLAARYATFGPRSLPLYRVIHKVLALNLTYLPQDALLDLAEATTAMDAEGRLVPGKIIEAGCALGGSAIVMAAAKTPTRSFEIYDVFGMIPSPGERDGSDAHERYEVIASGQSQGIGSNPYYGYQSDILARVVANFQLCGIEPEANRVSFLPGLFEDTLAPNEPIALAHLDCDWYDSVMTCLARIVPFLSAGGRLVIDDYDHWSGCRRAIDDFFADKQNEFEFVKKSRLHIVKR